MSYTLGIDLGSSFARAAVCTDETPRLLCALPSVVAFPKKGDAVSGEVARRQAYISPSRSCTDILSTIAGTQRREIDGHFYSGVEIAGVLLRELRAMAQAALGQELRHCVLSVPDGFGWEERRALREASALAGLHVEGFIVESCAAALGSNAFPGRHEQILLCDAGGGRFKAAVLRQSDEGIKRLSFAESRDAGGHGFDSCIAAWLLQRFREEHGADLSRDVNAMQRIMEAAELAKCRLSENSITTISIPYITAEKDEPLHLEQQLSRSLFYELAARLIREMELGIQKALEDTGEAERIVITGGGAAMPALREIAGRTAFVPHGGETATALGAALAARNNYAAETAMT